MCDIWFTKYNSTESGGYTQFMPVQATEDGLAETTTSTDRFYILSLPGVSKEHPTVAKLFEPHYGESAENEAPIIARRRWVLRGLDLPAAARQKFQTLGRVIIKAGEYDGPYDYTWKQVKNYLRDNLLSADMTDDL